MQKVFLPDSVSPTNLMILFKLYYSSFEGLVVANYGVNKHYLDESMGTNLQEQVLFKASSSLLTSNYKYEII